MQALEQKMIVSDLFLKTTFLIFTHDVISKLALDNLYKELFKGDDAIFC